MLKSLKPFKPKPHRKRQHSQKKPDPNKHSSQRKNTRMYPMRHHTRNLNEVKITKENEGHEYGFN